MEETILIPEEAAAPKVRKKLYAEHYMAILAGILAVITAALTIICLPYMKPEEQPEDPQQLLQGGGIILALQHPLGGLANLTGRHQTHGTGQLPGGGYALDAGA